MNRSTPDPPMEPPTGRRSGAREIRPGSRSARVGASPQGSERKCTTVQSWMSAATKKSSITAREHPPPQAPLAEPRRRSVPAVVPPRISQRQVWRSGLASLAQTPQAMQNRRGRCTANTRPRTKGCPSSAAIWGAHESAETSPPRARATDRPTRDRCQIKAETRAQPSFLDWLVPRS